MATNRKAKQPKASKKPPVRKTAKAAAPSKPKAAARPSKAVKPAAKSSSKPPAKSSSKPPAKAQGVKPSPKPVHKAVPKPKSAPQLRKSLPAEKPPIKSTTPAPSPSPTRSSATLSAEPSRSIPSPSSDSPTSAPNQVRYLTPQDIIELHRAVSVEFGGNQAQPGVVDSQFGLLNAIQRPQTTVFGKDAYPTFGEKAAAFLFALLQNSPFRGGNRRVALASLVAFCELNERTVDPRVLDEKTFETIVKRAATYKDSGLAPEVVFREIRELMDRAISRPRP